MAQASRDEDSPRTLTGTLAVPSDPDDDHVDAVPLRHIGRWILATVVLFLFVWLVQSLWVNPNIDHATITTYLFSPRILQGAVLTIALTVISMPIAIVIGVLLALMRLSKNPVLQGMAWFYVWVFRGTPLLVQIVFWGYLGLLYSQIGLTIPFTDMHIFAVETNALVTPFVAGIMALSLNEAAYSAEIVRAGMLSIDSGQREAAYSLGMPAGFTLMKIELPQAMRVIIPPLANDTISMLKDTALLSLIGVLEMYTVAQQISSQNLRQVEMLVIVSFWYLMLTTALSIPQHYLERHYGTGTTTVGPSLFGRLGSFARNGSKRAADKEGETSL